MTERAKRLSLLGLRGDKGRDPEVTGIALDSRQVKPGYLFAALPGSTVHGGEFIQYALRQGAGTILTDRKGAEIAAGELAASARMRCRVRGSGVVWASLAVKSPCTPMVPRLIALCPSACQI